MFGRKKNGKHKNLSDFDSQVSVEDKMNGIFHLIQVISRGQGQLENKRGCCRGPGLDFSSWSELSIWVLGVFNFK